MENSENRVKRQYRYFTQEQGQFVRDHVKGTSDKDLLVMLNEHFNEDITLSQLRSYKLNHHLTNGIDPRFKKGHKSIGYRFTKGSQPPNTEPIGTLRKKRDGWYIKYRQYHMGTDGNWKQYHIFLWEVANQREIPKGHTVVFLDGNKDNFDLDNLRLVPESERMIANVHIGLSNDGELNNTIFNLAKLQLAISKKNKEKQTTEKEEK